MPGFVKATVLLARGSGIAEDTVANSFYFGNNVSDILSSAGATTLQSRLNDFYNVAHGGQLPICQILSEALDRSTNSAQTLFYATDQLEPPTQWGSPVQVRSWTLGGATASKPMPAEVAAVLSFHGDLTDQPETAINPNPPPNIIRPASRLRGRLYIGPLEDNCVVEDPVTHEADLSTTLIGSLTQSASALLALNDADYAWVGASKAGDFFFEILGGFVDNAFDTQRRRGNAATTRTNWT